jgi:hypothetical protein
VTRYPLTAGLGDTGLESTLTAIARIPAFRAPPVAIEVDDLTVEPGPDWPRALLRARRDGAALWTSSPDNDRDACRVDIAARASALTFQVPNAFAAVDEAVALLEQLPFEVCSLGTVWPDEWAKLVDDPISFGGAHLVHGWGCAFRGAGHERLVSRRWLDHGPWCVIRRPNDLTVIQFHDLAADAATAYREARPGHERIGVTDTGGYLPQPYYYSQTVEGLYVAETGTLEIVVPPGDGVEQVRMRDACAIRHEHRIRPPRKRRIEQVAFVFLDEADALARLHELWLRELECWVADDRPKRRLDIEYNPPPRN